MVSPATYVGTSGTAGPDWSELLADACRGVGLRPVYQPIIDVARGTIAGYEALIRFDRGPANPEVWFAAARSHGLGAELDAAAVRAALSNRLTLPTNTFMTVNVCPPSLSEPAMRAVWAENGSLEGLVVELTEQTPIDCYDSLLSDIARLRAAGAMIAVDDAGAGYAGLSHMLTLRPEVIKLDRALVTDVDIDETKRALVEMMGTLSSRIDAWLLAEGVERPGELATLADLGVPLVQGFHLARPAPCWPEIDMNAALQLLSRSARSADRTLRSIVEIVPVVRSMADIGDIFANRTSELVVLLDDNDRPISAITADSALVGQGHAPFRINVDTPLDEAALRAITRERSTRFMSLLCTDAAGRFVGAVPMERLIQSLARSAEVTPAAGTPA